MATPSDNVYMTNLPADVTEASITQVFSLYGTVLSATVVASGAALVRFESVEEAQSIVTQMDGATPLGYENPVSIQFADNKPLSQAAFAGAPAQAPGYGKWQMAEKKLTTPWSIPGKGGAGPAALGTPDYLTSLGVSSIASKGAGKGGKPQPLPMPMPTEDIWGAAEAAAVAAAGSAPSGDDFDSLFEKYSSGTGDEQFPAQAAQPAPPPIAFQAPSWPQMVAPAAPAADALAWSAPTAGAPAEQAWEEEEAAWLAESQAAAPAMDAGAWGAEMQGMGISAEDMAWAVQQAAAGAYAATVPPPPPGVHPHAGNAEWAEPPPCDNLYIKGLPMGINEAWLMEALGGIGTAISVKILPNPGGHQTCAALARFDTVETAMSVRGILHGQSPEWCPGKIEAQYAKSRGGPSAPSGGADAAAQFAANSWAPPPPPAKGKGKGKSTSRADLLCAMVDETAVLPGEANRTPEASVYVAGLPGDTTEKHVYQLSAPFGAIISIGMKVGTHGKNGDWAVAFVNYVEPLSAQAAIAVYNGFQLPDGSVMKVTLKQSKGHPAAGKSNHQQALTNAGGWDAQPSLESLLGAAGAVA